MRINEYEKFEDFYYEYAYGKAFSWEDSNKRARYYGIEFRYNEKVYRLSNEPSFEEDGISIRNGQIGDYKTYTIDRYLIDDWKLIDSYKNLDEVLDNWIIDGKKFREVIMADETEILAKD